MFNDNPDYNPENTKKVLDSGINYLNSDISHKFLFLNILPVHSDYTFTSDQKDIFLSDLSDDQALKAASSPNIVNYFNGEELDFKDFEYRKKAYKASIRYADSLIEDFYRQAPEDTIFIVMSDHGELVGDYELNGRRLIGHLTGTYKELIRVPFTVFSKNSNLNLDINQDLLYDHRDVIGIIDNLSGGDSEIGREVVRSEYFGFESLSDSVNRDLSSQGKEFGRRKSFSLINKDIKYDITSDGVRVWPTEDLTEVERLDVSEVPEDIRKKADIFYSHHID